MTSQRAAEDDFDLLTAGFVARRHDLVQRVQDGVQRVVAAQLASGHPVFSSGVAADAGRLFMHTPDGQCREYRRRADGGREIMPNAAP